VAHHAVLVTDARDAVRDRLTAAGAATAVHYPYLVQEMSGLAVRGEPTPRADALRSQVLSVPCFPEQTADEVDRVVAALAEATRP
jgi:dTDP-4-amino-4,6-dideoxygalactose transaminase